MVRRVAVACLASGMLAVAGTNARAQVPPRDSAGAGAPVMVTPGARYRAGWLHKAIFGANYRSLWTTPIEVPVLRLDTVAGGLQATQRGGSMQTSALRFDGANGREYVFRPIDKDIARGLPEDLRTTLVADIAQDVASGNHPAAALVTARLLDATGIHHARPRLHVVPDDPRLGEFRAEFAGILGTLEERPGTDFDETPETPGATTVVSSQRLFERLRADPDNVVNARAYLTARLFDILVGDRDRHRDQWRWGRFGNAPDRSWEPIPRDRDFPFARFDGLGARLVRNVVPQLVTFTKDYPDMVWLNWNAREIDRRLLVGLERPAWDSAARALQAQVTDAEIDSALSRMPAPYLQLNGAELREALIHRRGQLVRAARDYYDVLARQVDLSGTDLPDLVEIARAPDGSVSVSLARMPATGAGGRSDPYLRRRFLEGETHEVRLYLHGGDDRVIVRGVPGRRIIVRVIGGDGDDTLVDSIAGGDRGLRFYDASGQDRWVSDGPATIDRRVYAPAPLDRPEHPVRDWGSWAYTQPAMSVAPAIGVLASLSRTRFVYAFRNDEYYTRSVMRLDVSLTEGRPRLTYAGNIRRRTSPWAGNLQVTASGLELIRFHGFGNETAADQGTGYYRVFQNLFRVEPAWAVRTGSATWSLAAVGQYSSTREGRETLVGQAHPYGSGNFGEAGARLGVHVDRRDSQTAPSRGFRLTASSGVFPAIWDVARTFGDARVVASGYTSIEGSAATTFAVRAGAQHVWGTFPLHEAAFLGGSATLRGWPEQRFAGRSAIFGSAEVRLRLGRAKMIVPAEVGLLGFSDVGRVVSDGEASRAWHSGVGGGIWIAPLTRSNTVSLSLARSRDHRGVYVGSGFAF